MAFNSLQYSCRSGPQDRVHSDRFFYIKGSGWYLHLRGDQELCDGIQVSSGIAGPFDTKLDARVYLGRLIEKLAS